MTIVRKPDGWWIAGIPDTENNGPYATRREAEADRRGLARFFRNENDHTFFTTEAAR